MENNNFQQPAAPQGNSSKGLSIAALVCGILGLIGGWIPIVCYFTFVLAIIGIVLGARGMKIASETGEGKGLATAGLVLGIIGTVIGGIGLICTICLSAAVCATL